MCTYTIKHYWDDETSEATIEPKWITSSSSELSSEQKKVKKIVNKLFSATNYNYLSRDKPQKESIEGFDLIYTYRDKKDPHPSRDRMVTDVTICITKKKKYLSYILGFIILSVSLYFFLSNNSQKIAVKETVVETNKTVRETKDLKINKKEIVKKQTPFDKLREQVCSDEKFNVKLPDKCWQYFVASKCTKKVDNFYKQWLENQRLENRVSPECNAIEGLEGDKDYHKFEGEIKDEKTKKRFKNFLEGRK